MSVFQFNRAMESHFKKNPNFRNVHVKGEVSGKYISPKNHLYFILKDKRSQVPCIVYSWFRKNIDFEIEDGMKLLVIANVSVYPPQGKYQLDVRAAVEDGLGQLYVKYQQLKKKLKKEGLFDEAHKKELPHFPKRIGVITSPGGSVIHDIIKTIMKNWPYCNVIVFPSAVQGASSKNELIQQIRMADDSNMDVLIIARGGGSLEELWAYNEEELVRTVFECSTPTISAVSHEDNVTLCDLVSDKRASTPTMAASMAVEDKSHIISNINHYNSRLITFMSSKMEDYEKQLKFILSKSVFTDETYVYRSKSDDLDDLCNRFSIVSGDVVNSSRVMFDKITNEYVIRHPCKMQLDSSRSNLNDCKVRLMDAMNKLINESELNLDRTTNKFKFLSDKIVTSKKHDLEISKYYFLTNPCQNQINLSKNSLEVTKEKLISMVNSNIQNNYVNLDLVINNFKNNSNEIISNNSHKLDSIKSLRLIKNPKRIYEIKSYELNQFKNEKIIKNPYLIIDSHKLELNIYKDKLDKINQVIELKKHQEKQKRIYLIVIVGVVIVMVVILIISFGGIL